MITSEIPEGFTEEFLAWFRGRTEAAWSNYQERSFDEYVAARVGGVDWQRGTRWMHSLDATEIDDVEQRWSVRFPPDYRRFLTCLHTVDRPMRGAMFTMEDEPRSDGRRSRMVPVERPSFYNWLTDGEAIQSQWNWLVEGLVFDVENNDLWLESWGEKPPTPHLREARMQELVENAPRLVPVFSHRYLLTEPYEEDNPVFSIHQSDIIVYGHDLRSYFLVEFADLIGIDRAQARSDAGAVANNRGSDYTKIPFWGELWNA